MTVESLRAQVGVMMQDPFVFSGTIADNIRYGRLDATMAEIQEAARAVRAHEFISELPGGYEAPVNEAGTNLSVGQNATRPRAVAGRASCWLDCYSLVPRTDNRSTKR